MDPDTARAIAQISAEATRMGAIIALAGALVVGVLSQIGQYLLEGRKARFQLIHSREQDWRNELARRVDSILAIADGRMGLYKRAVVESALPTATPGDLEALLLSTVHGDVDVFRTTAYLGVPDTAFHAAVQGFMTQDIQARHRVQDLIKSMSGHWSEFAAKADAQKRMADLIEPLNEAIWNLHEAANGAVYSGGVTVPQATKPFERPKWISRNKGGTN